MVRMRGFSTARNRGKLCGNQVFRVGDDAANNYSGEVTARMPKTLSLGVASPERISKEARPGPSVVPSVHRVNRLNARQTRRIPLSQSSLRSMGP
jgi:hypothetical protein